MPVHIRATRAKSSVGAPYSSRRVPSVMRFHLALSDHGQVLADRDGLEREVRVAVLLIERAAKLDQPTVYDPTCCEHDARRTSRCSRA